MFSSRYTFKVLDTEFYYEKNSEKADVNFDLFFKGDSSSVVLYGYNHFGINHRKTVTKKEHPTLFACLVSLISQINNNDIVTGNFCGGDLIVVKEGYIVKTMYSGSILLDSPQDVYGCRKDNTRNGKVTYQVNIVRKTGFSEWFTVSEEVYDELLAMFHE